MTDLTMMTGQFVADVSAQSIPQPGAGQRFDALMNAPAGADVYTAQALAPGSDALRPVEMPHELLSWGNELSSQMRAALAKPSDVQAIDTERFPELAAMQSISMETRHFMLLSTQIEFVSKSAEVSEKGLQTLYKQQG
jgi:uncharacterized protein (DUF1501 family)